MSHTARFVRGTVCSFVAFVLMVLTTSTTGIEAASGSHLLVGVPATAQAWALSCEYAATSTAMAYYGNTIHQGTFLTAIGYDPNPHKGFRGSIAGKWGGTTDYGVYAEPILSVLRRNGFGHSSVFYGGQGTLQAELAAGHPVVTWISGTWGGVSRYAKVDAIGAS